MGRKPSRWGGGLGGSTLQVRSRSKRSGSDVLKVAGRVAAVVAALAVVVAGIWFGVRVAGAALYSSNGAFTIRTLRFIPDDRIVRGFFRMKFQVEEGANLFGFDAGAARAEFLRVSPNYREVEMTRRLPGTLTIALHEREPLARFGRGDGFVIDSDGVVFGPRARYGVLPAILGYKGRALKPGDKVDGLSRDAVFLLETCNGPDFAQEFVIRSVDVRGNFRARPDDLRMYLDGETTIDIWWSRGHKDAGRGDLKRRLLKLRGMLRQEREAGRRLKSVNLTLDNFEQSTTFEYWN